MPDICWMKWYLRIEPVPFRSVRDYGKRAVTGKKNCVPLTDGVECGNCARHCPSGAILMVPSDKDNPASVRIPLMTPMRNV